MFGAAETFGAELIEASLQAEENVQRRRPAFQSRRVSFAPGLSLTHFRDAPRFHCRPAAADLAFSICALAHGWTEIDVAGALRVEYLSRDTNLQKQLTFGERSPKHNSD